MAEPLYPGPGNIVPSLESPLDPQADPLPYEPTEEEQQLCKAISEKREKWREVRQPHEQQWYVNIAFFRGQQYVVWSERDQKLSVPDAPSHRIRLTINRYFAKIRARRAKFLKNRVKWHVVPATPEQRDKQNARSSQKALDYQHRRCKMEHKYRDALGHADMTGHGYFWFYWDPNVVARVQTQDPMTGDKKVQEARLGDIIVEPSGPWEVLVGDNTVPTIGKQEEIIRIKMRDISEVKSRYPEKAAYVATGSSKANDLFRWQRQAAALSNAGGGSADQIDQKKAESHEVLVTEYFRRPCPDYPKGRYVVMAGDELILKDVHELPYGFYDMDNPFPVEEFIDVWVSGQYWGPTVAEQLIGLQKEYNLLRSKVAEQIRLMAFPKLLAARQHAIPVGAWTSEAGEVVEFTALPGVPPPVPWTPPNIAADVWQTIELIQREFDDVTQIYPAAEGKNAGANSGFQVNLLQEATDTVHTPDSRLHELAWEAIAYKLRRMMKFGYSIERLLTIAGRGYEPDMIEFSSEQIDENADIIVEAGSMLPDSKVQRAQVVEKFFSAGLLGDIADPEVRRKALQMMEMSTLEDAFSDARKHEDLAKIENNMLLDGKQVPLPEFWQNHQIHYNSHIDELINPESFKWPPQLRMAFVLHLLKHVEYINPAQAAILANEYGLLQAMKPETIAMVMGGMPGAPQPAGPGQPNGESPNANRPQ